MKSLRSTGRSTAARAAHEMLGAALEIRPVGQHRQAGRAALADRRAPAPAGSKSGRIRPPDGEAFLISAIRPNPPQAQASFSAAPKPRGWSLRWRDLARSASIAVFALRRGDLIARVGADPGQDVRDGTGASSGIEPARCRVSVSLVVRLGSGVSRRKVSSAASAAPAVDAPARPARRRRADQRRGRRRSARRRRSAARCRDMAPGAPCSNAASAAALSAASPPRIAATGARGSPASLGCHGEGADRAVVQVPTTWFSPATVSSSRPSPCTSQAALGAQAGRASQPSARPARGRTRRSAAGVTPAGLASGPSRLNIVRVPELDARAGGVAHRGVVAGREQEGAAGGAQDDAAAAPSATSTLTPSAVSTSAPPVRERQRAVAVLGHRHPAAGDDECHGGGDVQRAGIRRRRCRRRRSRPSGASTRSHPRAHRAHGAGDLGHGLAAHPHRHQQARRSAPASPRRT